MCVCARANVRAYVYESVIACIPNCRRASVCLRVWLHIVRNVRKKPSLPRRLESPRGKESRLPHSADIFLNFIHLHSGQFPGRIRSPGWPWDLKPFMQGMLIILSCGSGREEGPKLCKSRRRESQGVCASPGFAFTSSLSAIWGNASSEMTLVLSACFCFYVNMQSRRFASCQMRERRSSYCCIYLGSLCATLNGL